MRRARIGSALRFTVVAVLFAALAAGCTLQRDPSTSAVSSGSGSEDVGPSPEQAQQGADLDPSGELGPLDSSPAPSNLPGLVGKVIVIDPGHNGRNGAHSSDIGKSVDIGNGQKECDTTGAATPDGYSESAFNWDVSQRLENLLMQAGATVVLTRHDDEGWGPCITERAAIGNDAGADAAISIHADGASSSARGFHVLYPAEITGLTDDIYEQSLDLAIALRDAYAVGTGMPYSSYLGKQALMPRSDLGGLNLSDVPKVFIEAGNMRNSADAELLSDPAFRQTIAQSLADGLSIFFLSQSAQR